MSDYKNPLCRGWYALGTACGRCERCAEERSKLKIVPPLMSDLTDKATAWDAVAAKNAELTALRARLAQAEAENAVMVAALHEEMGGEDGGFYRCRVCKREAETGVELVRHKTDCPLADTPESARRLLAIEAAALESARLAFDESASDEAVEAAAAKLIAALSRHGNPEDPK